MKISTDSVLIGAWADTKKAKTILDIGTGTGIIALMLAQRSPAHIDAIEIDEHACKTAGDNFASSKWKKRLNIHCSSLQDFYSKKKYDLIISNPPYFPLPVSHNKSNAGAQARYTHNLNFTDLAEHVIRLLSPAGKFFVIFPIQEGAYFTNEAEKRKLYLTDYVWVKTTDRKKFPKRILMQFEFSRQPVLDDKVLTIQHENFYSPEYKELTRDYYINF